MANREIPWLEYTFILSDLYVTVRSVKKMVQDSIRLDYIYASKVCCCSQFEGPLDVKNQFPIFLPINQPYLEQVAAENSVFVSLSHFSVFVIFISHWMWSRISALDAVEPDRSVRGPDIALLAYRNFPNRHHRNDLGNGRQILRGMRRSRFQITEDANTRGGVEYHFKCFHKHEV